MWPLGLAYLLPVARCGGLYRVGNAIRLPEDFAARRAGQKYGTQAYFALQLPAHCRSDRRAPTVKAFRRVDTDFTRLRNLRRQATNRAEADQITPPPST